MDRGYGARHSEAAVSQQIEIILRAWGVAPSHLRDTVDAILFGDLSGVDTHGISLLLLIDKWRRLSHYDISAEPSIEREGPTFALLNANNALGYAVATKASRLAISKAQANGIAVVSVHHSHHFGAAGYYSRLISSAGLISLVATSTKVVSVTPPNAANSVLGTNPLAYGVPRRGSEPIVFDMATSTAAGSKIRMLELQGLDIPVGWVVDGNGEPITESKAAAKAVFHGGPGGLTPLGATPLLGSHKGYGLGLLVHFLGGSLGGGRFWGDPRPGPGEDNIGHFFLAIDPAMFRAREDFFADVESVCETLTRTKSSDPAKPVLLPGDIEASKRADRLRNGIPMSDALLGALKELCGTLSVDFVLSS